MDIDQAIAEGEEVISVKLAARTEEIAALIASKFPPKTLEQIGKEFEAGSALEGEVNEAVAGLAVIAREQAAMAVDDFKKAEMWITLKAPPISDGNNFGVTVQMTVAKFLKDTREELGKKLDAIPAYYASRADAVDKLGLAKTTSSRTKTETESNSAGGKDGDESKKSTTVSTEEKETAQAKADYHRSQAVLAIDVQCYADLHSTLQSLLTGYVCVLDNMEKNESKLRAPKGSSNSMGMY